MSVVLVYEQQNMFTEIQHTLNTVILSEENGNWVLPTQGDELRNISLSNLTSSKFVTNISNLFDTIFKYHDDDGEKNKMLQKCVYVYPTIIGRFR